jgi:TonB family protein
MTMTARVLNLPLRRGTFIAMLCVALMGSRDVARDASRYIVTAQPIDVGAGRPICVAVDTTSRQGVSWWEPGTSGCRSRSTGPGVFKGDNANVSRSAKSDAVAFKFRLGTHSAERQFADLQFIVEKGILRLIGSDTRVPVERRSDLNLPERRTPEPSRSAAAPCTYRESAFRCCVTPPQAIHRVEPDLTGLPPVAAGQIAIVEVRIDATGRVTEACVLRGVDAAIDRRVLAAVHAWRFEPPRLTAAVNTRERNWKAGDAVPIFMTVTVRLGRLPKS